MPIHHETVDEALERITGMTAEQRAEQDRKWARKAWNRIRFDDDTRDHYRAKWEQDR